MVAIDGRVLPDSASCVPNDAGRGASLISMRCTAPRPSRGRDLGVARSSTNRGNVRSVQVFPPPPRGLRGRTAELETLARTIAKTAPARVALVGAGGSGKSMLAAALGHRVASRFDGSIHWFRVGRWDFRTLVEMLALRFGVRRGRTSELVPALRALLAQGERLVVLDNHEDDREMAKLLDAFAETRATFVVTARRCLLSGVLIFPVTAPLVTSGRSAFPRVARMTRLLRWNPLALDVADALVRTRATSAGALHTYLEAKGAGRVREIDHEDDLPEVLLLVAWAWARLGAESRRMLATLSHVEGDHVDAASLGELARVPPARAKAALAALLRWHLVQEPLRGRFAAHAVVRHGVAKWTEAARASTHARAFAHYLAMLERDPARLALEQTHLFAAMDHAQRAGDLAGMLRIEELLAGLSGPVR